MYAVGRLISRSIYTVSGPFHPFGGAVDIVVVEQPDGSYKSSPWYVRFGKFQGVLKRREKVVSICVNGVDADFHLYLDHTGEAYFFEEVEEEVEEIVLESSLSSELTNEDLNSHTPMKSLSCNFDAEGSLIDSPETGSGRTRTGSKRARLLGLVFGRRLSQGEPSPDIGRANSLDRAEIAADLLDANWSAELALDKPKLQKLSLSSENLILNDECFVNGDSLDQNLALTSADVSLIQETSGLISEFSQEFSELHIHVRADEQIREKARLLTDTDPLNLCLVECPSDIKSLQEIDTSVAEEFIESQQAPQSNGIIFGTEVKLTESVKTNDTKQISSESLLCKDDVIDCEGIPLIEDSCNLKVNTELSSVLGDDAGMQNLRLAISSPRDAILQSESDREVSGEGHEDEQFIFSDDEFKPTEHRKMSLSSSSSVEKELDTLVTNEDANSPEANDNNLISCNETFALLEKDLKENAEKKFEELLEKQQQKISFPIDIHGFYDANTEIDERMVESLPNMWSQIDSLEADLQPCRSFDASATSPRWLSVRNNVFSRRKSNEDVEEVTSISEPTAAADDEQAEMSKSDSVSSGVGDPSKTIVVPSGTWRLWPFAFKRETSLNNTTPLVNPSSNNVSSTDVKHPTESATHTTENIIKSEVRRKIVKKMMRSITPTSAQLKSLSLKEGGNIVTFTFSTAMLGKQQVDARIYLWKWDARIVISDVDGTITKSDVLGQFMPMVGYDWSHIGVTHLFSAIKENGYQLLFLSARSISQSYITRQFLFNLKQDGKTLPDGPVVISPDGLFPSLYREVIRRAPHEFKIACLEDIKALFPPECNPFYAGFGNRDTDEISYLKVGIPKGKIFIINPKGEVKVHRRVDTNSYTDLHTLANGIFPPICSSEQEDFNSWNFWKLPPCMDLEL